MSVEAPPIDEPKRIGVFSTGLALFSMFFGAGNLIFPLIVGRMAASETLYAIVGLGISAVIFPLLGLVAMMLYHGNIRAFLERLGRIPSVVLLLVLQMSQGPFGAMPRLVALMHASIQPYFPTLSLFWFSVAICALIFWLILRPQKIIALLGSLLTPFLLVSLGILIVVGIWHAPQAPIAPMEGGHYLAVGLKMGYQTTDLIAALLFATLILPYLSQGTQDRRTIWKRMTLASLIASTLLMLTYMGLCWVSAYQSSSFLDVAPEHLLQHIAVKLLGPAGGIVASIAVFLACFTTAISLAAVFAQYLQVEVSKERIDRKTALLITLGCTALIANLGFGSIVKLWGPLLEVLYPALIVLCVFNIAYSIYKVQPIRGPVFFALGLAVGGYCFA